MPRSARHANLETRTGRARLRMRRAPYFVKIAKGLRLGYYRGATAGTWIGRRYLGSGSYETDPLGLADDTTEADEVKSWTIGKPKKPSGVGLNAADLPM